MFYRDKMTIMLEEKSAIFPSVQFYYGLLFETKQPLYYSKCAHTHTYTTSNYPILHFIPKPVEIILIVLRC